MKRLFNSMLPYLTGLLFLASCGGGGGGSDTGAGANAGLYASKTVSYSPVDCTTAGRNEFVYKLMNDTYLWYDKVPQVDYRQYASPDELLAALRYNTLDKWSYISTKEESDQLNAAGAYIGLGYSTYIYANSYLRITYVYKNSAAYAAGLGRGDTILGIGGKTVAEIAAGNLWDKVLGEGRAGVSISHTVQDSAGAIREVVLVTGWVTMDMVLTRTIFESGGKRVGYLALQSFYQPSLQEMWSVFSYFQQQGVEKLIVDLRYNHGGLVSAADYLASLITGSDTDGSIAASLLYNDKHSNWNSAYYFTGQPNSLNLKDVVFIATGQTCSASELVVNMLKPHIKTVLVGTPTCGKPVGSLARNFCDSTMHAIEFKIMNSRTEGEYFSGLSPACVAYDNIDKQLGDVREDMLAAALYYLANDRCSVLYRKGDEEAARTTVQLEGIRKEVGAL